MRMGLNPRAKLSERDILQVAIGHHLEVRNPPTNYKFIVRLIARLSNIFWQPKDSMLAIEVQPPGPVAVRNLTQFT